MLDKRLEQILRQGYKDVMEEKFIKSRSCFVHPKFNYKRCIQGTCMPLRGSEKSAFYSDITVRRENKVQWDQIFMHGGSLALQYLNDNTDKTLGELAALLRQRVIDLYGVDIADTKDVKKMTEEILENKTYTKQLEFVE